MDTAYHNICHFLDNDTIASLKLVSKKWRFIASQHVRYVFDITDLDYLFMHLHQLYYFDDKYIYQIDYNNFEMNNDDEVKISGAQFTILGTIDHDYMMFHKFHPQKLPANLVSILLDYEKHELVKKLIKDIPHNYLIKYVLIDVCSQGRLGAVQEIYRCLTKNERKKINKVKIFKAAIKNPDISIFIFLWDKYSQFFPFKKIIELVIIKGTDEIVSYLNRKLKHLVNKYIHEDEIKKVFERIWCPKIFLVIERYSKLGGNRNFIKETDKKIYKYIKNGIYDGNCYRFVERYTSKILQDSNVLNSVIETIIKDKMPYTLKILLNYASKHNISIPSHTWMLHISYCGNNLCHVLFPHLQEPITEILDKHVCPCIASKRFFMKYRTQDHTKLLANKNYYNACLKRSVMMDCLEWFQELIENNLWSHKINHKYYFGVAVTYSNSIMTYIMEKWYNYLILSRDFFHELWKENAQLSDTQLASNMRHFVENNYVDSELCNVHNGSIVFDVDNYSEMAVFHNIYYLFPYETFNKWKDSKINMNVIRCGPKIEILSIFFNDNYLTEADILEILFCNIKSRRNSSDWYRSVQMFCFSYITTFLDFFPFLIKNKIFWLNTLKFVAKDKSLGHVITYARNAVVDDPEYKETYLKYLCKYYQKYYDDGTFDDPRDDYYYYENPNYVDKNRNENVNITFLRIGLEAAVEFNLITPEEEELIWKQEKIDKLVIKL